MPIDYVTIAASEAAVDAYILPKEKAILMFAERYGIPLSAIAAIGHDTKDVSFLQTPGLGFVGAPANASDHVKAVVAGLGDRGYVSPQSYYAGFFDFHDQASLRDIRFVLTARSGLLKNGIQDWSADLSHVVQHMGRPGWPYVCLLTASSLEQNRDFLTAAGLDARLSSRKEIREHPYLVLVENGALHYNVLTGVTEAFSATLDQHLFQALQGEFTHTLQRLLCDDILPHFGLRQSTAYEDQRGAVYIPKKQTMVTVNIPRQFSDGAPDYRRSEQASDLRHDVLGAMITAAKKCDILYRVL